MDTKTATVNFFALLMFTVSAARLVVDRPVTDPSAVSTDGASKLTKKMHPSAGESADSGGSNTFPLGEEVKTAFDETTANNRNHEPENTTNDVTPGANFSRFHPINRHFFSKPIRGPKQIGTHRRPCRKHTQYRIHRTGIADRIDEMKAGRTDSSKAESFRGGVPSNWLKVKHHYSSRGHQNNQRNEKDENGMKTKNMFDREKLKSLIQHEEKKREKEAGSDLMKSIRKFLKHTFD